LEKEARKKLISDVEGAGTIATMSKKATAPTVVTGSQRGSAAIAGRTRRR
jgi:hypothetical protein